jgi:phosphatidylglycerophosphate synthase
VGYELEDEIHGPVYFKIHQTPYFSPDIDTPGAPSAGYQTGSSHICCRLSGDRWRRLLRSGIRLVARLTGRASSEGALLDSLLDRYMDFALLFGILSHCLRYSSGIGEMESVFNWTWIILLAGLAAAGSSQISYATARAASLNLDFSRPELAGKGSRTAVIIICGLLTPFWIHFPLVALVYLAVHTNLAVILSMAKLKIR